MEIGSNLKEFWTDGKDRYIDTPLAEGNYIKATMGIAAAGVYTLFVLPDYVFAGIIGKKLNAPKGTFTGRDLGEMKEDIKDIRIPSTVLDVVRLPGSIAVDVLNTIGGFERKKMQRVLNHASYDQAA